MLYFFSYFKQRRNWERKRWYECRTSPLPRLRLPRFSRRFCSRSSLYGRSFCSSRPSCCSWRSLWRSCCSCRRWQLWSLRWFELESSYCPLPLSELFYERRPQYWTRCSGLKRGLLKHLNSSPLCFIHPTLYLERVIYRLSEPHFEL